MIELRDIAFAYGRDAPVLELPALTIEPGLTLVVGPNGAGKSTLLRLIAGVEKPKRGTITIDGDDVWVNEVAARRRLAYVPEQPELTPYATIVEVMQLVAGLRGLGNGSAVDALMRTGLDGLMHRTVRELSMGQRRRAVLATALIGTPGILLLDEPLETMDFGMRAFVQTLAREHASAGGTVMIATHEIEPFAAETDVVVALRAGRAQVSRLDPASRGADRVNIIEALARAEPL